MRLARAGRLGIVRGEAPQEPGSCRRPGTDRSDRLGKPIDGFGCLAKSLQTARTIITRVLADIVLLLALENAEDIELVQIL